MISPLKGILLVLLSSLCFSVSGTLQALAPEGATPFIITESRMLIGALFLFLWCALTRKLPHSLSSIPWKPLILCGLFLAIGQICFFTGMYHIGVSTGAIISVGSSPLFAAVIARILYKKTPSASWYIATFLAIVGIVMINGLSIEFDRALYIVVLLMDGFFYAAYITISPKLMDKLNADTAVMLVLSVVAVILLPTLFIFPTAWAYSSVRGILVCLGIGIITAGMAFTLLTAGARLVSPTVASTLCLAEPMAAACWGIFLLKEDSSPLTLTGIGMIFASIIVLLVAESQAELKRHRTNLT